MYSLKTLHSIIVWHRAYSLSQTCSYTKVGSLTPTTMSLLILDEVVRASGLTEDKLLQELVLLLFQRKKISIGKASQSLGITQLET